MDIFPELESEAMMKKAEQEFRRKMESIGQDQPHNKSAVAGVCLGMVAVAAGIIWLFGLMIA